jgi:hypothetical protein
MNVIDFYKEKTFNKDFELRKQFGETAFSDFIFTKDDLLFFAEEFYKSKIGVISDEFDFLEVGVRIKCNSKNKQAKYYTVGSVYEVVSVYSFNGKRLRSVSIKNDKNQTKFISRSVFKKHFQIQK